MVAGRIYCGNLPWSTDDAALAAFFEPCGQIVEAKVGNWLHPPQGYIVFATSLSCFAMVVTETGALCTNAVDSYIERLMVAVSVSGFD
jgi:hypothetical protein